MQTKTEKTINLSDLFRSLKTTIASDIKEEQKYLRENEVKTIKPVWIELGLQTSNDRTAKLINRCYTLDEYDKTMNNLKRLDVHVVVHMIIGLPGETKQDMISTVRYIADSGADGDRKSDV